MDSAISIFMLGWSTVLISWAVTYLCNRVYLFIKSLFW